MLPSNIGAISASVTERGSQFAVNGVIQAMLSRPARDSSSFEVTMLIDGVDVAVSPVDSDSAEAGTSGGALRRVEFSMAIPSEYYGRSVELGLRTSFGAMVGDGIIKLEIDPHGNAFLLELNDRQRKMLSRAPQFIRDGKPRRAYDVYGRSFCDELFSDFRISCLAARSFASFMDTASATIVLERALFPSMDGYSSLSQVGKILLSLDRHAEAEELFDRAIALDPTQFDARNGKIKAIIGREDWPLALAEAHRLREALPPDAPQIADIAGTIAWLYLNISDPERALVEATVARTKFPQNTRLMQMHGDALVRLSRYDEAIPIYQAARAIAPKDALLRKRLASALMLVGEFGEAADQDVGRMLTPTFAKLNNQPEDVALWLGEPRLPGKLLVWSEVNFGVGQNLLHASLVPELVEIGLDVVLEVEPRLVPVMQAAFPTVEVVEQPVPGIDRGAWMAGVARHIPIGSLSRYLRRTIDDFEFSRPFLEHDRLRSARIRHELLKRAPQANLLVGISWTSNNPYVGDDKSVPLASLLSALDLPGLAVTNLQYGDQGEIIAKASAETGTTVLQYHEVDNTDDLVGLCDLMGAMDMVVCIGHTTAHLAGGLGIPNFVMLPSSPFSHWLGEGERCVWYRDSTLIRQTPEQRGDWTQVLETIQQRVAMRILDIKEIKNPVPAPKGHPAINFACNALDISMLNYNYEAALEIVSYLEQFHPTDPKGLETIGDCFFRFGEFNRAIRYFDRAIVNGGLKPQVAMKKVKVFLENYDLEAARAVIEDLLDEDPSIAVDDPDLVVTHAQILANQGDFEKIYTPISKLIARDPGNVDAVLTGAHAYSRRNKHNKAIDLLTEAVKTTSSPALKQALAIEIGHAGMPDLAAHGLDLALSAERDAVGVFWRGQFAQAVQPATRFRLAALDGDLPSNASIGVTVYICVDTSYCMKYLRSIAASIIANAPATKLHVHIVNPHDAAMNLVEMARQRLGPDRFSCSFERAKLGDLSPEGRKTYFASIRFVRLAEIMHACPGTYYVMDADNIVRGELRSCVSLTRGADVLIRNRFSLQPHLAVAACGILLSDTDAARDFIDRTSRYIVTAFESGDVAWFLDQIALTIALNENSKIFGTKVNVRQLPSSLLDWDFLDASLVWTGKGKRRSKNGRYLEDYEHYFEMFVKPVLEEI